MQPEGQQLGVWLAACVSYQGPTQHLGLAPETRGAPSHPHALSTNGNQLKPPSLTAAPTRPDTSSGGRLTPPHDRWGEEPWMAAGGTAQASGSIPDLFTSRVSGARGPSFSQASAHTVRCPEPVPSTCLRPSLANVCPAHLAPGSVHQTLAHPDLQQQLMAQPKTRSPRGSGGRPPALSVCRCC